MEKWRPIKTAVVGETILLVKFLYNKPIYEVGYWNGKHGIVGNECSQRKIGTNDWYSPRNVVVFKKATHWMPLPKPPNIKP